MQRDGGLARAGAPLDEEHAREGASNDLVLLALDRRDDVAHPARSSLTQRGE